MPINILMPALSPTMEKGNLAKWLKKEGDAVKSGDVIAEIETDKATMEVEAVDEGTLAKIVVPEGTADVPVNQVIAVLAGEGEDVKAAASGAGKTAAPAPKSAAAPKPTCCCACAEARAATNCRSCTGPNSAGSAACRRQPHFLIAAGAPAREGIRHRSHRASRARARAAAWWRATSRPRNPAKACGPPLRRARRPVQRRPHWPRRCPTTRCARCSRTAPTKSCRTTICARVIAQRITASTQTIPHFYLTMDCNIGKLLQAREEINAQAVKDKDGKPTYKLSVNDFVIKALALALQRIPNANVTWTDGGMLKHKHSDIGVAVALPGGLITPIVRKAETKSLAAISNEMRDYAARARARKLKPEEYQGGTSAISNLGMYGIKDFTAVINPPHATILAVGAGEERAIARDGKIEAAMMMSVTLSCDHRAVDGALGAELLGAFKTLIENPVMMVV